MANAFNIPIQQNRTDVEANVEVVCAGLKEKSICCSLTLMLADIESVYFAACNFKTTEKSGLNLGIFERVCKNFRME